MTEPTAIMIFAAGFGTRMRPLSNDRPKPMVELNKRPMIDYALDHARTAGAETIAVNLHYKAEVLERHLAGTNIHTIREDEQILDTGGGLRNALPVLGTGPVWTLNPDAVWRGPNPLEFVARHWDPEKMDALLLCVDPANAIGSDSQGDFSIDTAGHLTRAKGSIYGGAQIVKTDRLADFPEASFSLNKLWDVLISEKTCFGCIYPGQWCDVGHPAGIPQAEALLSDV